MQSQFCSTCWSASSARLSAAGDKETVQLLLRHGADANADADAGPPLMWATGSRRTGAAAALLEARADPNRLGPNDVSALLTAAATGGACLQTDEVSRDSAVQSTGLLSSKSAGTEGACCTMLETGSMLAAQGSSSCCTVSYSRFAISSLLTHFRRQAPEPSILPSQCLNTDAIALQAA